LARVGLRGPGDTLTAVVLADGDERPCGRLLVSVTMRQRSAAAVVHSLADELLHAPQPAPTGA
jgi:hypothetical protein